MTIFQKTYAGASVIFGVSSRLWSTGWELGSAWNFGYCVSLSWSLFQYESDGFSDEDDEE
jgi:hypothetical protein